MDDIVARACARIAPAWPLDRFIAVNPFWGLIDAPVADVAAKLRSLSGAELLMPRAWYREAHRDGRLTDEHIVAALRETASRLSLTDVKGLLALDEAPPAPRPRMVDLLDAERNLSREPSWRAFVAHSVSQHAAAYFDEGQATTHPDREGGLYASWRRAAAHDRSPELAMDFVGFRALASGLPVRSDDLFAPALAALEVPLGEREEYLWSLLLDQNGWASWCAYRRWTARLRGADDDEIRELLAIRLAWEWLLLQKGGDDAQPRTRLGLRASPAAERCSRADDWVLQTAMEAAWRSPVTASLLAGLRAARPVRASVQAVFCIDVRSEVFRRALEATSPSVQTLGFAGFFGLPIEYAAGSDEAPRPHLPGLLAPALRVASDSEPSTARRTAHVANANALGADALATFATVEARGLLYAWELAAESLGRSRAGHHAGRPRLAGTAGGGPLDAAARADLAAGVLRAMSLTHGFSPLVLLAGHGSSSSNNPHAAGLDCGACGGHSGEVNARVAAALLNDRDVRDGLRERGIDVPVSTWFVAGLHDTTTDDFTLFDLEDVPPALRARLDVFRAQLRDAGTVARTERASRLGIGSSASSSLLDRAIRRRSSDWSEVRPEWGLANNAGFIIAPRERSLHINLEGRAFLHEYRQEEDEGYRVLELIMTAPMVVTHWINFQYYASTVDNAHYGSGNKVLHNVVGGHLGVFEGNGGDLRIGLPLQSLNDGKRWIHTPLRLGVFIEAPRDAIDAIIAKHDVVRSLVSHGWVGLFQLDGQKGAVYAYRGGLWEKETGR